MKYVKQIKPVYLVIILLTLISQRIVYNDVLYPTLETNITSYHQILKGESEPPFQYRVLKPLVTVGLNTLLTPFVDNEVLRFSISFKILLLIGFFTLYLVLFLFLKNFYCETTALIGILLLQVSIPLTMTHSNCFEEGDCITAFFYLLAFFCMFAKKDYWIPLIVAIGTLNREQTIFIVIFYAAYLIDQRKLLKRQSIVIILSSIAVYAAVFFLIRAYFGFISSRFTNELHMFINFTGKLSILRLWFEQVFIFIAISIFVFRKSRLFFKLALISLIPYTLFFYFYGVMGELGKFLPALIILITISLQIIRKEYTGLAEEKTNSHLTHKAA